MRTKISAGNVLSVSAALSSVEMDWRTRSFASYMQTCLLYEISGVGEL